MRFTKNASDKWWEVVKCLIILANFDDSLTDQLYVSDRLSNNCNKTTVKRLIFHSCLFSSLWPEKLNEITKQKKERKTERLRKTLVEIISFECFAFFVCLFDVEDDDYRKLEQNATSLSRNEECTETAIDAWLKTSVSCNYSNIFERKSRKTFWRWEKKAVKSIVA